MHNHADAVHHRGAAVAAAGPQFGNLLFHTLDALLLVLPLREKSLSGSRQIFGRDAEGIRCRPEQGILLARVAQSGLTGDDGQAFHTVLNGRRTHDANRANAPWLVVMRPTARLNVVIGNAQDSN